MDISDKVALITGGASGLGLATANKLLSSGAKIMLVDLNEDNVKKASENLGDKTAFAIANVTDEDSVAECIKSTVDKFGGIHIVVNCAGIGSASKTVGKDGAHPLQYFKTVIDIIKTWLELQDQPHRTTSSALRCRSYTRKTKNQQDFGVRAGQTPAKC